MNLKNMGGKLCLIYLFIVISVIPVLAQSRVIVVDKTSLQLYVIENTDTLFSAPICVGANLGDKKKKGDRKTPEGVFSISKMQNSSKWKHDFKDGNGLISGAYGPWFFRLKTPKWTSIGIHGTCFPESIGKRKSEGCIRLNNEDLLKLRPFIKIGTKVIITKDELKSRKQPK